MDAQLKRGMLEACVLASALREDTYGYQIIKDLEPILPLSESTLYPILRRLESSGALEVRAVPHNGRLRKYYRITDVGRSRLAEFMEQWRTVQRVYQFIEEEMAHE